MSAAANAAKRLVSIGSLAETTIKARDMNGPRVFADFHNADAQGRLRLNCIGTVEDLASQQITLRAGQWLTLYSEDLEVEGQVEYSTEENLWVVVIDWDAIRHQERRVAQRSSAVEAPAVA